MRSLIIPLAGVAMLAGCHSSPAPTAAGGEASADASSAAAPDAKPGIALSGAKLVLPAVSGNPGALYFTLANASPAAVSVAAVHVDGAARAEMHETTGGTMKPIAQVPVPPGGRVVFAPGGKHVMLFDLSTSLVAHGATEMTLTFAGGDKISAPVDVVSAGSTDAPMAM